MSKLGDSVRVSITVETNRSLNLPIHYNHVLQGLIYNQLEPNLATWLHGSAYNFDKRSFKMFTFSRLFGQFQFDKKTRRIQFSGPVSFKLASHHSDILASFAEHLLKCEYLELGANKVFVRGVEILKPPKPDYKKPIKIKTLSPITTYSTFTKPDGKKLTHYYNPQEKDWSEMLVSNLARKANALDWQDQAIEALKDAYIKPLNIRDKDKKIVKYKKHVIQAWMGLYIVNLPQAFFELAYDVGLGSKNAQGFGMVEVI